MNEIGFNQNKNSIQHEKANYHNSIVIVIN